MKVITMEVTPAVCNFVRPLFDFMRCILNFGTSVFSLGRRHHYARPLRDAISRSN